MTPIQQARADLSREMAEDKKRVGEVHAKVGHLSREAVEDVLLAVWLLYGDVFKQQNREP